MQGENFLLALARIFLNFVGFAGIVSMLRHGRDAPWTKVEVRGLKLMFELCLVSTVFAVLPFPLLYTLGIGNERTLWRISSSLLSCYMAYALGSQYYLYKRSPPPPRHPNLFRWLYLLPISIFLIIEIGTAAFWPSVAGYAWGLLGLLIPPIVQFFIFIGHFDVITTPNDK